MEYWDRETDLSYQLGRRLFALGPLFFVYCSIPELRKRMSSRLLLVSSHQCAPLLLVVDSPACLCSMTVCIECPSSFQNLLLRSHYNFHKTNFFQTSCIVDRCRRVDRRCQEDRTLQRRETNPLPAILDKNHSLDQPCSARRIGFSLHIFFLVMMLRGYR